MKEEAAEAQARHAMDHGVKVEVAATATAAASGVAATAAVVAPAFMTPGGIPFLSLH